MQVTYPSDVTEATADFTKSLSLSSKDFLAAKKNFKKANAGNLKKMFLNYCLAVINQKNNGLLTIREAAYIIGNCAVNAAAQEPAIQSIIDEASNLQRHPSNYKANHQEGWERLVKMISGLRKRLR